VGSVFWQLMQVVYLLLEATAHGAQRNPMVRKARRWQDQAAAHATSGLGEAILPLDMRHHRHKSGRYSPVYEAMSVVLCAD